MADETGGHVAVTRRQWDEHMAAWFERYARSRWAAAEPCWGIWCIPQSRLPVLPDGLAGTVAVEFGCGSGYVSAWLAQRGVRPVGVDVSARQLAIARHLQGEFGLRFPLVQADAERAPRRGSGRLPAGVLARSEVLKAHPACLPRVWLARRRRGTVTAEPQPVVASAQLAVSDHSETITTFVAWTNSGPAE